MAIATAGALILAAAEEGEIVSSGDTLTTAENASCLDRLNRLIDQSRANRALIYSERIDLLTMVSGTQTYTIGVDPAGILTAAFNVPRPTKITRANLLLSSTVRRPIDILDFTQWAAIRYQTVSGPPKGVYLDGAFTSGFSTLYFDNAPDANYQWEMYSWRPNAALASTATGVDYPPGYAAYWLYKLALAILPMFGRTPSPTLIENLREATEIVGALNAPSPLLGTEAGIEAQGGGLYDWWDGQVE